MRVPLKGIVKITAKGKVYWYAWRGGPRLRGDYGSPEFHASYNEAVADRRAPDTARFRGVVSAYKASPEYQKLAKATKAKWGPALDKVSEYFGELRIAQFDRPEKIKPIIRTWRNQWADRPRTADLNLQVLSRVLSHAVDPLGKIADNPCVGIKRLYSSNRADIIWTDADLDKTKSVCAPELAWAIDLAAHTGLRRGDLLRLSWSHIESDAIVLPTGKSRGRIEVVVPLYDALRDVLAGIPKRQFKVLTSSRQEAWTESGLESAVTRAKHAAGMVGRNLHFHDLRGTAATKFYIANLPIRVIAEILGWTEDNVDKIIRSYVGRSAATAAIIRQINEAGRRT